MKTPAAKNPKDLTDYEQTTCIDGSSINAGENADENPGENEKPSPIPISIPQSGIPNPQLFSNRQITRSPNQISRLLKLCRPRILETRHSILDNNLNDPPWSLTNENA